MTRASDPDWYDRTPCGLVSASLDQTIVVANDTLSQWIGVARDDLIGRPLTGLFAPGSRMVFETRHRQILHLQGFAHEIALTLRTAAGEDLPVLVNASRDDETGVFRYAIFNATDRLRYERELLAARRSAEQSEQRVRILQEVSTAFEVSATDEDVAESFVAVAREAFAPRESAVLLAHSDGGLSLTAGRDPLSDRAGSGWHLRDMWDVTVVHADDDSRPELARAMREVRLASISVMPLVADGERLGVLACYFAARTDFDADFLELQRALGRQASQTLQRVRLQRRLALLALHDQLTGVANRQLLQLTLDDALAGAVAASEPLAVIFLDADEFKRVNDTFGHAAGDTVLVELATRLRGAVRSGDVVGRIGGDEFVAICPGADAEAAEAIAQRLLSVCRLPVAVADGVVSPSVSVGISLYRPEDAAPATAQHLLIRADAAMYDAKRAGRDRLALGF